MPSAPLTVADPLDLPGLAYTARTAATRTFGRRPDEATGEDEGGRGFRLVNEIAQHWGFLRERGCTCVWFELVLG